MPSAPEGTSDKLKAFWLSRWQENDIGWHHEEFNPHLLGFWRNLEVPAGARILVPLCGKTRDMVWLAEHHYRILGIEISPVAVSTFFAERGLEPRITDEKRFSRWQAGPFEILCGDLFLLQQEDLLQVDAVYDRASLVALEREQRQAYAALLTRLLSSGCDILLVAMDYPQHEMQGPPFSVTDHEVGELFGSEFEIQRLDSLDLIKDTDRYRNRGLSRMSEQIYRLTKS